MGKLINRYALFDAIRNITYNRQDADTLFEEVLEIIAEQPTTTEAEIMAMAIDEFAKVLEEKSTLFRHIESEEYGMLHYNEIYTIAEQLKEE